MRPPMISAILIKEQTESESSAQLNTTESREDKRHLKFTEECCAQGDV